MAESAGIDLISGYHIRSSSTLTEIWNAPTSYTDIRDAYGQFDEALPTLEWDHLVLQASDNGSSTLGTDAAVFKQYRDLAAQLPANDDTRLYVYGAWPWNTRWNSWDAPAGSDPDPPSWHRRDYFERLVDELNANDTDVWRYIPVGEVFSQVRDIANGEGFSSYSSSYVGLYRDAIHANARGQFLAATTVLATVFKINPIGLPVPRSINGWNSFVLPDELALELQQLVWEIVVDEKRTGVSPYGDFNVDTRVDHEDYAMWSSTYGHQSSLSADANGDGVVDPADHDLWSAALLPSPADLDSDGVPSIADYMTWREAYGERGVSLADINQDGVVNAADYTVWRDANEFYKSADFNGDGIVNIADESVWQTETGWSVNLPADVNQDGVVNAADYTVWRDAHELQVRLGELPPGASSAVPEPTTLAAALLAAASIGFRRRS